MDGSPMNYNEFSLKESGELKYLTDDLIEPR